MRSKVLSIVLIALGACWSLAASSGAAETPDMAACQRRCLSEQNTCNKACGDDLACVQRCSDKALACVAKCSP